MASRTSAPRKPRRKGSASTKPKKSFLARNGGEFMTPEEVSEVLGVTERMVRRLCHRKDLKNCHVGRVLRIHRDDLDEYILRIRKGE